MPKATLEFDLNELDDIVAHYRTMKSTDMALSLFQFGHNTKKTFEHNIDKYETKEDLLDGVYEKFWEILEEHGINLDKLVI
jgi:hypothetical protein